MVTLDVRARIAPGVEHYGAGFTYRESGAIYSGWHRHGRIYTALSIKAHIIPNITIRARITKQQGWPVPDMSDPAYLTFVDTSLLIKSSIYHPILTYNTTDLSIKARISPKHMQSLGINAKIVSAGQISIKARISPKSASNTCAIYFAIRQVARRRATVVFYTRGKYYRPSITIKARIVKSKTAILSTHFMVGLPAQTGPVIYIGDFITQASYKQSLQIKARIIK